MEIYILVATMFCTDVKKLIKEMNIKSNCVVVNQCDIKEETIQNLTIDDKKIIFISTNERGLSKSRNKALLHTPENANIIIFTDDDIHFVDGYEKIITNVYKDTTIDGCSFGVIRLNGKPSKKLSKKINKITMLRICSVSMTFKYHSIKDMKFDLDFGTGSGKYLSGEENIFVGDCLNNGLKIISDRNIICKEDNKRESTWFKGVNKEYLISRGAVFKRIYPKFYWLLNLDFATRKYKKYSKNMNYFKALKYLFTGSKEYQKSI